LITSCWDDTFTPLESQAWVARTGEPAGRPLEHLDGVLYAAFSHDGRRAITCGEDFMAILWDPTTGRQLSPPLRHRDQVFYAAFNEDDSLVATAAAHAEVADAMVVAVWSVETGEPLTSLALPSALRRQRTSIRFTPDNKELIIRNGLEQSFRWVLPFYTRPLQDLLLDVQLRSARQTDSTESLMPHSKETLRAIYQQLRSIYPEDFSLQPE
jgi:WD40 repeat protein